MKEFYNRKGQLTNYALACGYIEQTEYLMQSVTLWKEASCYHVRRHNFFNHTRVYWHVYDTLTEARKDYTQAAHNIKALCFIPRS